MSDPILERSPGSPESTNLTKNQLLMWMDQKSRPDVPLYNIPITYYIAGKIDPGHFQKAFQALLDRSDTLRIVIEEKCGVPRQRVLEKFPYTVEYLDFSGHSTPAAALDAWVRERCVIPFNLAGRLFDCALLKLADDQFVWYWNKHHLIIDGLSDSLLYQRLSELYERSLAGRLEGIDGYPGFMEYVENERQYRRSEQYREAERYWKEKLSAPVEPLRFFGKSLLQESSRVATILCDLGKDRTARIKALAEEKDFSSFSLNLSIFNIFSAFLFAFLYRMSGNRRLSIGVPFHNRHSGRLREIVGLLMEVAPLHVEISGEDTLLSLVNKVKDEMSVVRQHCRYSPGNPLNNRAYEVVLNFHKASYEDFAHLPAQTKWHHSGYERDVLAFHINDFMQEGRFVIECEFNCEIFDAEQQAQTISHFLNLVDSFLENRNQKIDQISLLSPEQKRHILEDFNRAEAAFPVEQIVIQMFEARAQKTPDHIAVVYGGESLTYRELNIRSNQLAHHLRSLGVGAETLVGICLERSLEMIVGLLGILKAGGAYVPLDPLFPKERLSYMLQDTHAPVLLTQKRLLANLPDYPCKIVLLDQNWPVIEQAGNNNPDLAALPENLAYVIYTSGSTGKPKGVMIQHRSLANYTEVAATRYAIQPQDRALQFASINFDASAEEIYPALARGAALFLRNEAMIGSAALFLQTCREWEITVLNLPTAYWHALVNGIDAENLLFPPSVRLVIIGGEKALPGHLDTWQKHIDQNVRLMNTYGPTESTIVATMGELTGQESGLRVQQELIIGSPVGNVQVYVLDSHLQPVPAGVAGELHIGGAGLARGYLNDPQSTAEKFIPNPFSKAPGERLYKTGDLVRWRRDGSLEFVGRGDQQVKIRGFRIEPGEIETVLNKFPGVKESLVVVKEPVPNHQRLVAYLVMDSKEASPDGKLRGFLKEKLPDYMTPSAFVRLNALPLTPNGKIDSRALPNPDWSNTEPNNAFEAPRTSVEKTLADIWARVLQVERVGLQDNFFELGGDSILSIQVIAKANQAGILLSLADLMRYQTIAELAAVAGQGRYIEAEQGIVRGPVPFTPYQHWFFEQNLPDPHHWNMAILLEIREKLQDELVPEVLRHLTLHHDALRLRFFREGSGWRQINAGADEAEAAQFVRLDLSALSPAEQEKALAEAAEEQQAGLNLAGGPLLRFVLFECGTSQRNRLLIIVHHMVMDGISFRILLEDFETAYRQLSEGKAISLPPKTTSYQQWAERLAEDARSDSLAREMAYWSGGYGREIPPVPVDYPGGANTTASTQSVRVCLSSGETQTLLQETPAAYNTQINDVLLTALALAFSSWTGSKALLFDLEGHGREDIIAGVDLSRTVGCFTSLFPVILDIGNAVDPGSRIKLVKESLRSIPNKGIGYGILRYLCNRPEIPQKLKALPQAEVSFNYLGQFDQVLPASSRFAITAGDVGPVRSPREIRRYILEILGRTVQNQLQLDFMYSHNIHRRDTIKRLSEDFIENLRSLIHHCQSVKAGGYTPSDFPGAKLDQKTLDRVLSKLKS